MIEIGNKRWRNLQEQVAWLTAMIGQATDVVKNIYGTVADAASLPSASTFSNGTTFAVGSAAPFEYYVAINGVWLDIGTFPLEGPAATDGEDGNSIFITSQATTSGTTAIPAATIYNPDSLTIHAGDMIFSEEGNVFAVTGVNSMPGYNVVYRCNITGPTGATGPAGQPGQPGSPGSPGSPGEDGATWKAGSAVIHVDGSGGAFVIPVSSYTGAKVGDFYLSTTTYTSDGFTINKGDVWTITNMTGDGTYGVLSRSTNIEGPQGVQGDPGSPGSPGTPGQDGAQIILSSATTTSSTTTIDASTMTAELHPPAIGDVVISASGDVFIITGEGAGTLFTVQYGLSIGGGGGPAIPTPTAEDNGKMLGVENGVYALVEGGGGGSLYAHYISSSWGNPHYAIKCVVICDRSAAFTKADFGAYLYNQGLVNGDKCVPTSGYVVDNNVEYPAAGIFGDSSSAIYIQRQTNTGSGTVILPAKPFFQDTVVQIL